MNWLLFLALSCSLLSGAVASGEVSARDYKTTRKDGPAQIDAAVETARTHFTAEIKNGHLKGFDEERAQVIFKSSQKDDSAHRPGPMEDDVIAATLRSRVAGDSALQKVGLKIRSDAGRVQFSGAPADPGALARLIVLALDIDGVIGVRADLPAALRVKS